MRTAFLALLFLYVAVGQSYAETTTNVNQAKISGEVIKLGQGADIVQSRIKADRFVSSGYNYGDISKGYYIQGDVTYVITFGPPDTGSGAYVVKRIEKIKK